VQGRPSDSVAIRITAVSADGQAVPLPGKSGVELLSHRAPAGCPGLRLELFTPAERCRPVVEIAKADRTIVDEPDDQCALRPRIDHGMRHVPAWALHAPEHGRLAVDEGDRSIVHAANEASAIPSANASLFGGRSRLRLRKVRERATLGSQAGAWGQRHHGA
jgi:hypothetical protein